MEPEPVLAIVSVLSRRPRLIEPAFDQLTARWPELRITAPPYLFDETRYYEEELGHPLFRWWAFRKKLANPARLVEWKHYCTEVEKDLSSASGDRSVNIDPGYLNYNRLVLASFKNDRQKIYLGERVYADPVLRYFKGQFRPFDWSFPDFKSSRYYSLFENYRENYRKLRNQS